MGKSKRKTKKSPFIVTLIYLLIIGVCGYLSFYNYTEM